MIFCASASASGSARRGRRRVRRRNFRSWRDRWRRGRAAELTGAASRSGVEVRRECGRSAAGTGALAAASPSARFGAASFRRSAKRFPLAASSRLGELRSLLQPETAGCAARPVIEPLQCRNGGVVPWPASSPLALLVSLRLRSLGARLSGRGGLDRLASGRGLARCGLGRRFRWHLVPEKFAHGWPISGKPVYCAAGVS